MWTGCELNNKACHKRSIIPCQANTGGYKTRSSLWGRRGGVSHMDIGRQLKSGAGWEQPPLCWPSPWCLLKCVRHEDWTWWAGNRCHWSMLPSRNVFECVGKVYYTHNKIQLNSKKTTEIMKIGHNSKVKEIRLGTMAPAASSFFLSDWQNNLSPLILGF